MYTKVLERRYCKRTPMYWGEKLCWTRGGVQDRKRVTPEEPSAPLFEAHTFSCHVGFVVVSWWRYLIDRDAWFLFLMMVRVDFLSPCWRLFWRWLSSCRVASHDVIVVLIYIAFFFWKTWPCAIPLSRDDVLTWSFFVDRKQTKKIVFKMVTPIFPPYKASSGLGFEKFLS